MKKSTAQKRGKMNREKTLKITDDLRRNIFAAKYSNPDSETFSNAYKSALVAGFSEEYAQVITGQPWFKALSESISNSMLATAERNLARTLNLPEKTHAMGAFGPLYEKKVVNKKKVKVPIMTFNGTLMKYRLDASKFISERLGRKKYGKDPDTLVPVQVNIHSDRNAYA